MSQFVTFYKLKKEQLKQFLEADDKLKYDSESLSFNGLFFSSLDFFQRKIIFSKIVMPHCIKNSKEALIEALNFWYPYEVAEIVAEMQKNKNEDLSRDWTEEFINDFGQIFTFFQTASKDANFIVEEVSY